MFENSLFTNSGGNAPQRTPPAEKDSFWRNEMYVLGLVAILWVVQIFKRMIGADFAEFGLIPHDKDHLWGILTAPFIHGDEMHLASNTLAILVLLSVLLNAYQKVSVPVLLFVHLVSGIMVWFIGNPMSVHVGISGIIYGIAGFLIASGFFRRDFKSVAIAIFIALVYGGGMIAGLIPKERISWEWHLSGAISGVIIAWLLKSIDKPIPHEFDLEDKEPDKHFFE
jgi:membrane associated rhomboid family serine protease